MIWKARGSTLQLVSCARLNGRDAARGEHDGRPGVELDDGGRAHVVVRASAVPRLRFAELAVVQPAHSHRGGQRFAVQRSVLPPSSKRQRARRCRLWPPSRPTAGSHRHTNALRTPCRRIERQQDRAVAGRAAADVVAHVEQADRRRLVHRLLARLRRRRVRWPTKSLAPQDADTRPTRRPAGWPAPDRRW